MSNHSSTPPISVPPPSNRQRRASITSGLSFPDYRSGSQGLTGPSPSSMASAVASAQPNHRRRPSITTLGLSGSPTQTSPFGSRSFRHGSISSSVGSPAAEEAVSESGENSPPSGLPTSPFARRVSFGAQALREARGGSIGSGRCHPSTPVSPIAGGRRTSYSSSAGGIPSIPSVAKPTGSQKPLAASTNKTVPQNDRSNPSSWRQLGEGFNWSEALRARAERGGPVSPTFSQNSQQLGHPHHRRAASIASMDQPSREIPKQTKQNNNNKPDFFQEKILRGDFMD